jgi:serine protease Do
VSHRLRVAHSPRGWLAAVAGAWLVLGGCSDKRQPTESPAAVTSPAPAAAPLEPGSPGLPTSQPLPPAPEPSGYLPSSFAPLVKRANPSVVTVKAQVEKEIRGRKRVVGEGLGTAFVYDARGYLLTNHHVVADATSIVITLEDGRDLQASIVGRDRHTDLAVVKVEEQGLPALPLGDSDQIEVGDWVVAIGNPFGLSHTVSTGILSAKGRTRDDVKGLDANGYFNFLQTDASINPGNSGGPLCTLAGEVLGINTMIIGKASGIGFAVPSNMAQKVAAQLLKNGYVQRAHLGVGIQDLNADLAAALQVQPPSGALVTNVGEGSPAALANLKAGDVLVEVGGKPVRDSHELMREVIAHDVGESVDVVYVRAGKRASTKASLTARPEPVVTVPSGGAANGSGSMGLALRDLNPREAAQIGLPAKAIAIVTAVMPGSPADKAAVQPGDVIVEVDGQEHPSTDVVARSAADGQLLLRVRRKSGIFYAALKAR